MASNRTFISMKHGKHLNILSFVDFYPPCFLSHPKIKSVVWMRNEGDLA